ncbi:hypothetical protein C8R43DRAFT_1032621 [Mycena crocata]|nr:hypothetical protein C8R43DRAFT_1032621 [Mycena crocata]
MHSSALQSEYLRSFQSASPRVRHRRRHGQSNRPLAVRAFRHGLSHLGACGRRYFCHSPTVRYVAPLVWDRLFGCAVGRGGATLRMMRWLGMLDVPAARHLVLFPLAAAYSPASVSSPPSTSTSSPLHAGSSSSVGRADRGCDRLHNRGKDATIPAMEAVHNRIMAATEGIRRMMGILLIPMGPEMHNGSQNEIPCPQFSLDPSGVFCQLYL